MSGARFTEVLRAGAPFVLLGALLGAGYFAALRLNVERYLVGAIRSAQRWRSTSAGCSWQGSASP